MPGWYYEKKELKNTPSALDGIDYSTEMRYRKDGARLIINVGKKMVLGCNTVATGVVYYHRFYMFHSFKQFPRYVTACCCLFLAGKVEETPKKCKDIIKTARSLLTDQKFTTFGEDPKEEVMTLERILLQTIKFDLQVEHPYQYLVKYAKCFKGDKSKLEHMVEMAWTFVNDSLCTTLCLQWEPEIIAVALMYLAGKLSKFEVTDWMGRTQKHCRWWDMFVEGVTMDLLEDICHQVLDLYSQSDSDNAPDSPPLTPQKGGPPKPLPASRPLVTAAALEKTLSLSPDQPPPPPINVKAPPPQSDLPPPQYPYQAYPGIPVFAPPPTVSAPPPHIAAPPPGPPPHIAAPPPNVFSYVSHPPPFPPVGQAAPPPPFFSASAPPPGQPHRPYYPPPT